MSLSDETGLDLDPERELIYVLINANDLAQEFIVPDLAGISSWR